MHGWKDERFGRQSENDGFKYLLIVIDTFSRYCWAFPLKGKTSAEVRQAFQSIGIVPKGICADQGREFMGDFSQWAAGQGIEIYNIFSVHKAAIAERMIRTLQTLLFRVMTARDTRRWVPLIPEVLKFYNTSKHSSLKMTPVEARDPANAAEVWENLYGDHYRQPWIPDPPAEPKYALGDRVRVSVARDAMEKGFWGNWSLEVFQVVGISYGRPVMYVLKDGKGEVIQGKFYEEELQKTRFPDSYKELKKTVTFKAKPKDFVVIEKILDVAEMKNGRSWKFKGQEMVWLKVKWVGTTPAQNEALPLERLWIPYVNLAFDEDGMPNPAIEEFLRGKRLWTRAQTVKDEFFKASRKAPKK